MASIITSSGPFNLSCAVCLDDFVGKDLNPREEILLGCRHRLHTSCAVIGRKILLLRGCYYCKAPVREMQIPVKLIVTQTFSEKMKAAWLDGNDHGQLNCDRIIISAMIGSSLTFLISSSAAASSLYTTFLTAAPSYNAVVGAAGISGALATVQMTAKFKEIICSTWVCWFGIRFLIINFHDYTSNNPDSTAEAVHNHLTVAAVSLTAGAILTRISGDICETVETMGHEIGESLSRLGG